MDGGMGVARIENYRSGARFGGKDGAHHGIRDCGVVDSCSPFYRSYLRAVRWLAEQCEQFCDEQENYGMDRFIKDVMMGKIAPNNDDYVIIGAQLSGRSPVSPIWLEEKTARLIREVQRDFDAKNETKYFGQFRTPCGRTMDQVRSQFYIDCFSECVHPHNPRNLKANTTECVPVPSSEHVAEIVGKKGGKIKNIRAETNTYIKTPKRDEEPVFVITGRKEDVGFAKSKILAAAEHFTQLREARRQNPGGPAPAAGPPRRDGDVTVSVEVPYEFVGLVVGQKGATIKRIQQDTCTYITTPSRRHRPIFEVIGQPGDVERAREAIQVHISSRVERFREGSAPTGDGYGPEPGPTAGVPFLGGVDDWTPGQPGDVGDLFGPLHNAHLGGTWSGFAPPAPPLPPQQSHRYMPPPPPTRSFSAGGMGGVGRLSAFRNLGLDDVKSIGAALMDLNIESDRQVSNSWRTEADSSFRAGPEPGWRPDGLGVEPGWQQADLRRPPLWMDGRGRAASLPAGDPANPPSSAAAGSVEPPTIGSLLFSRRGPLGWDAPVESLQMPLRSSKGSNETLNSDSGVDTTTPPPLDSVTFGPIGSKRSSFTPPFHL